MLITLYVYLYINYIIIFIYLLARPAANTTTSELIKIHKRPIKNNQKSLSTSHIILYFINNYYTDVGDN